MSESVKEPAVEELVAGQKTAVIKVLAQAGLAPDPVTAAALFEIGTQLLVLQGLNPEALTDRLQQIVLRTESFRLTQGASVH